ncbi:MAG: NosD domain-containing protein [Candidatus Bathyarchaeia archaeon]|jgi:parallel beta-helix repeat protein
MKEKAIIVLILFLVSSCLFHGNLGYVGVEASDTYPVHNVNTGLNYSSIQAAIDAPQTVNGNTILVDAGTYNTTFVVDKSLAIIGSGRENTVVDGGGGYSVVWVDANDVLFEGFTVKGGLVGIYVDHSDNCVLRENSLTDMTDYYAIWAVYSGNLTIDQNIVGPNSCSGILVSNSLGFQVMDNDVHNNGGQGYGINANASFNGVIAGNNVYQNAYDGIGLSKGSRNVTISKSTIRDNVLFGVDIIDPDCEDNLIYDNNIINNTKQASVFSPNRWDNGLEGNYWSDYVGVDQDQDGIGDTPYLVSGNNTDNYPLMGVFSVFKTSLGYDVDVISNSSIASFAYFASNGTIAMQVLSNVLSHTTSFCRVRIPHGLMTEPYNVTVDGASPLYWNYTVYDDGKSRWIYFEYQRSARGVVILGLPPPPTVSIVLPENKTYTVSDVPLTFTVDEETFSVTYSLDGQSNVTIDGNTTLPGVSNGTHVLVVYARNDFGETGASNPVYFSVSAVGSGLFLVWVSVAAVALAVTVVLVYFRVLKRKKREKNG